VEFELRRRLNELERRVGAIEAGHGGGDRKPETHFALLIGKANDAKDASAPNAAPGEIPEPKPRFDRKSYHRAYMREWRARQSALRETVSLTSPHQL
jgi:hypothetical protein